MIDVQLVWCHVGDWLLSVRPESMSAAAGVPLVLVWEETLEPLLVLWAELRTRAVPGTPSPALPRAAAAVSMSPSRGGASWCSQMTHS